MQIVTLQRCGYIMLFQANYNVISIPIRIRKRPI